MNYKNLYFELFGKIADIEETLESGDLKKAKSIVVQIEKDAEERYIDEEEKEIVIFSE